MKNPSILPYRLIGLALLALLSAAVMPAQAQQQPGGIITERLFYGHGTQRPLPDMKLVIREPALLFAVGEPEQGLIDFSKEMALFTSNHPASKAITSIEKVTRSGDKLNVTLSDSGSTTRRSLVAVPRSDAEVEDFSTSVPVVDGLVAESTPVVVDGEIDTKAFRSKAEELGYDVSSESPGGRLGRRGGYVGQVELYVGPDSAPQTVVCEIGGVPLGRNYGAMLHWIGRAGQGKSAQQRYPLNVARLEKALAATFEMDAEKAKEAAQKFATHRGTGMVMLTDSSMRQIKPESLIKYIGSDDELSWRHQVGGLGDFQQQRGPNGILTWRKPFIKATRKTEDRGEVIITLGETGTFQARFEGMKSTDAADLRKTVAELAEATGLKLKEESLNDAWFGFYLNETAAPPAKVEESVHGE